VTSELEFEYAKKYQSERFELEKLLAEKHLKYGKLF
jgi:hypothetical protein